MILVISLSCVVKLMVECRIFVVRSVIFVTFHAVFRDLKDHFFHDFITFCAKMSC